jgi:hypothetical protein
MSGAQWVVATLIVALPIAAHVAVVWRSSYLRMHLGLWLATLGTAAALVVPAILLERLFEGWAQIDPVAGTGGSITLLLYGFLVVAPLEMGLCTLAVAPYWRLRRIRMRAGVSRALETKEGVTFAVSAALGFGGLRGLLHLWLHASSWLDLARAALWLPMFALLCAGWGYALGRNAHRGMRGRRFNGAWLGATLFAAVCAELVVRKSPWALLAAMPLYGCMLVVALVLWRDVRTSEGTVTSGRLSSILAAAAPAPSLQAIREAFRRQDQPITLRWIAFGALVTTGMITTGFVGAVFVGHEIGVDFGAVERADAGLQALLPLLLLGGGVLLAFPSSGYLLARASGTRTVLEPAMAAALAIVLVMVLMGLVAPTSVVFAIAFAPIAFALSCAGAWVGLAN